MLKSASSIPPDGGYGWVILFACTLNNIITAPLFSTFGLIIQEAFEENDIDIAKGSLVLVLNHCASMFFSLFGGPLLRRFTYRKVAVFGAIFSSLGVMLTFFGYKLWLFILSYSIINSIGTSSCAAACSLALNSFFKEKRGRAYGIAMALTSLGGIFMPLIISTLIYTYGWRYAVLILGAICLHSLISATLLRPVEWYLKPPSTKEEITSLNKETDIEMMPVDRKTCETSSLTRSIRSNEEVIPKDKDEEIYPINSTTDEIIKEENVFSKSFRKFVDFFDLTLLADLKFVNIVVGISIAYCVESNFALLLPIILKDMLRFELSDIAKLMVAMGVSDILFRVIAPFIGECFKKSVRVMYVISLILTIITRSLLINASSFYGSALVMFLIGISKGLRTVYMKLVIPNYVPLERLPFALGIEKFLMGIISLAVGSLALRIRECTGSFAMPIIILNIFTMVTVISWTMEFLYLKIKRKTTSDEQG